MILHQMPLVDDPSLNKEEINAKSHSPEGSNAHIKEKEPSLDIKKYHPTKDILGDPKQGITTRSKLKDHEKNDISN